MNVQICVCMLRMGSYYVCCFTIWLWISNKHHWDIWKIHLMAWKILHAFKHFSHISYYRRIIFYLPNPFLLDCFMIINQLKWNQLSQLKQFIIKKKEHCSVFLFNPFPLIKIQSASIYWLPICARHSLNSRNIIANQYISENREIINKINKKNM